MRQTVMITYNHKFPKRGWIQPCIICGSATAYHHKATSISYFDIEYDFYAHMCCFCQRHLRRDTMDANDKKAYLRRRNRFTTQYFDTICVSHWL